VTVRPTRVMIAVACSALALLAGCKTLDDRIWEGDAAGALAEIQKSDKLENPNALLVRACSKGMLDVVMALQKKGAKLDASVNTSVSGNQYLSSATPLIAAVNANQRAVVDYLLAQKVDAWQTNKDGMNALTVAKDPGIRELLDARGLVEQVLVTDAWVIGMWRLGFPDIGTQNIYLLRQRGPVLAHAAKLSAFMDKYFTGSGLKWTYLRTMVQSEAENLGQLDQARSYNRMVELADEIPAEIKRLLALAASLPTYRTARLDMKQVPAGAFQRGASAADVSTVAAPFLMSATEITERQFAVVSGDWFKTDEAAKPLYTSWYRAIRYCNCLSIAESLTPVYAIKGSTDPEAWGAVPEKANDAQWDAVTADWSANGYRLPTEMEWMWAAMGAASGDAGYRRPFAGSTGSNKPEDYAWTIASSGDKSHPVAGLKPNELGLCDMSGNVWEWCWDWYGQYPTGALSSDAPEGRGPQSGFTRIYRGGSYHEGGTDIGYRTGVNPYSTYGNLGFRVVRNGSR
jgi:formylglycine-generating enzyme required for sulfatase activity